MAESASNTEPNKTTEQSIASGDIIVSDTGKHLGRWVLLGVLIVVIIAGLVVGGALLYNKSKPVAVKIDPKKNVTQQIQALTPEQAKSVASKNVDVQKDPETAYVKAVAQAETGNAKAAVVTYSQVVKATPTVKYYVYYDYAIAAAKAGNLTLAEQQMQKAIDAIKTDSSVSATVKATEIGNMEDKLQFFKLEAGA